MVEVDSAYKYIYIDVIKIYFSQFILNFHDMESINLDNINEIVEFCLDAIALEGLEGTFKCFNNIIYLFLIAQCQK
jgi:hypothetical protein